MCLVIIKFDFLLLYITKILAFYIIINVFELLLLSMFIDIILFSLLCISLVD